MTDSWNSGVPGENTIFPKAEKFLKPVPAALQLLKDIRLELVSETEVEQRVHDLPECSTSLCQIAEIFRLAQIGRDLENSLHWKMRQLIRGKISGGTGLVVLVVMIVC